MDSVRQAPFKRIAFIGYIPRHDLLRRAGQRHRSRLCLSRARALRAGGKRHGLLSPCRRFLERQRVADTLTPAVENSERDTGARRPAIGLDRRNHCGVSSVRGKE